MVIVADKQGRTDGSAHTLLTNVATPIPIVLITKVEGFEFNESLLSLDRYVLADFTEYGYDFKGGGHLFGQNTDAFADKFPGDQWSRFEDFVRNKPPVLYFKRELFLNQASQTVLPIEYPCWHDIPPIQAKYLFDSRPLEVFFSWGYSSERRRQVHGNIWTNAAKYGYMVCDNIGFVNSFIQEEKNPHKWLTANIPHYSRLPMDIIINVNGMAKMSLSLFGAGKKCFRHTESSVNSVMVIQENPLAWSYPWDSSNSIIIPEDKDEVEVMANALSRPDLYEIYREGVANCRKYKAETYIKQYLEHNINSI